MNESSKLTNILLGIIAICLLVIAFRPAGFLVPRATAQEAVAPTAPETDAERFATMTAADKGLREQAVAIRAIATSVESLSESAKEIAKSIDNLARAVTEASGRMAEGQAAEVPAPAPTTP